MNRRTWQKFEQRVAEFWGGFRNLVQKDRDAPDAIGVGELHIQCKARKTLAMWDWWQRAKLQAQRDEKIPVLVTKELGKRGFLITVHRDDLEQFMDEHERILKRLAEMDGE